MNNKIITIDGPSGVGKGTISHLLAKHFNYNYLDSGALYRITAHATASINIDLDNISHNEISQYEDTIAELALSLNIQFTATGQILLENKDIQALIRTQACGKKASIIAALPKIRAALLQKQKDFQSPSGLVADGRDMGTVVFPDAQFKFFLTASAEERGKRRYKQLHENKNNAIVSGSSHQQLKIPSQILSLKEVIEEIKQRDERDMNRSISPLIAAKDAIVIDTDNLSVDDVFNKILVICS